MARWTTAVVFRMMPLSELTEGRGLGVEAGFIVAAESRVDE